MQHYLVIRIGDHDYMLSYKIGFFKVKIFNIGKFPKNEHEGYPLDFKVVRASTVKDSILFWLSQVGDYVIRKVRRR